MRTSEGYARGGKTQDMRHSTFEDTEGEERTQWGEIKHRGCNVEVAKWQVGLKKSHATKQLSQRIAMGCHGPVPSNACGQAIPQVPL